MPSSAPPILPCGTTSWRLPAHAPSRSGVSSSAGWRRRWRFTIHGLAPPATNIGLGEGPMSDAPKSALELAMEKLKKKDAEAGVEAQTLTDAQRTAIADARSMYEARVAERRIMHRSAV